MIYQFTGQPGHGKTLHALDQALQFKDAGRVVYACNIRKLDHGKAGLLPMTPEQFKDWPNFLPDGAVCLVDECYEHEMLPKRGPGAKVPPHVEQLAKHRHRGIDFIFVCQSPGKQMDSFVHDLIEKHVHVRRRFGMNFVHLRVFDRYEARPEKAHPLMLQRVRLPKRPMGLYESTELDTTQKKVPWYYYAAGLIVVVVIAGVVTVTIRIRTQLDPERIAAKPAEMPLRDGATATARGGIVGGGEKNLGTATDYAKLHRPRFGTMPWTAPVYDQRSITVDPQLYCVSSLPGLDAQGRHVDFSCTCLTEQGTLYEISVAECRTIARRGPVYNPYRQSQPALPVAAPVQSQPVPVASVVPGSVIAGTMK